MIRNSFLENSSACSKKSRFGGDGKGLGGSMIRLSITKLVLERLKLLQ